MMYPNSQRQLTTTIDDLNRQIEVLVRRLGMIASSDVIENQKLCETYIEMINVRTAALRRCENLERTMILAEEEQGTHGLA